MREMEMTHVIVNESGVNVFGDEIDGPDAYDARETEVVAKADKLRSKAAKLRKVAEAVLHKAKDAENEASTLLQEYCGVYGPLSYYPDPMILAF